MQHTNRMTEDFEDMVYEHMQRQPYDCVCSVCGQSIEFKASIDGDGDLTLIVEPCTCGGEQT